MCKSNDKGLLHVVNFLTPGIFKFSWIFLCHEAKRHKQDNQSDLQCHLLDTLVN
jgi:hypothetical protein